MHATPRDEGEEGRAGEGREATDHVRAGATQVVSYHRERTLRARRDDARVRAACPRPLEPVENARRKSRRPVAGDSPGNHRAATTRSPARGRRGTPPSPSRTARVHAPCRARAREVRASSDLDRQVVVRLGSRNFASMARCPISLDENQMPRLPPLRSPPPRATRLCAARGRWRRRRTSDCTPNSTMISSSPRARDRTGDLSVARGP